MRKPRTSQSTNGPPILLSRNLRKLLKQPHMGIIRVSRMAEVPRQTIQNWLNGQIPQDVRSVKRVAEVFNLSVDQLCFGNPDKQDEAAPSEAKIVFASRDTAASTKFEVTIKQI